MASRARVITKMADINNCICQSSCAVDTVGHAKAIVEYLSIDTIFALTITPSIITYLTKSIASKRYTISVDFINIHSIRISIG